MTPGSGSRERQNTVERDRYHGRKEEGEQAPLGGWQPCGGPAFEEHADDEDGSDNASAVGADGVRLPVGDVAQKQVGKRATGDDEDIADAQARGDGRCIGPVWK
jgi:hypothetical protein